MSQELQNKIGPTFRELISDHAMASINIISFCCLIGRILGEEIFSFGPFQKEFLEICDDRLKFERNIFIIPKLCID